MPKTSDMTKQIHTRALSRTHWTIARSNSRVDAELVIDGDDISFDAEIHILFTWHFSSESNAVKLYESLNRVVDIANRIMGTGDYNTSVWFIPNPSPHIAINPPERIAERLYSEIEHLLNTTSVNIHSAADLKVDLARITTLYNCLKDDEEAKIFQLLYYIRSLAKNGNFNFVNRQKYLDELPMFKDMVHEAMTKTNPRGPWENPIKHGRGSNNPPCPNCTDTVLEKVGRSNPDGHDVFTCPNCGKSWKENPPKDTPDIIILENFKDQLQNEIIEMMRRVKS